MGNHRSLISFTIYRTTFLDLTEEARDYPKMLNKSADIISTKVTYICSRATQVGTRNLGCARNQRILFPHNGETNFIFVP